MANALVPDFSEADPYEATRPGWWDDPFASQAALKMALEDKAALVRVAGSPLLPKNRVGGEAVLSRLFPTRPVGQATAIDYLRTAAQIPGRMVNSLAQMALSGATLSGDVASGKTQLTDPETGNISDEAIRRSLDLTGLMASGSFAKAPSGALGSGPVRPVFYSAASRALDKVPLTTAPAEQWLGTLKNAGDLKGEELEGVERFLASRKGTPVSKDELAAAIQQNTPQIKETIKGGKNTRDELSPEDIESIEHDYELGNITDAEYDDLMSQAPEGSSDTKYSQYQLPGGENYREVLLSLPRKGELSPAEQVEWERLSDAAGSGYPMNPQQQARYRELNARVGEASGDQSVYRSSHWDEPNVLAHMRLNDRMLPDPTKPADTGFDWVVKNAQSGNKSLKFATEAEAQKYQENLPGPIRKNTKILQDWSPDRKIRNMNKTLFAEEFQSDWHQTGRKEGYKWSGNSTDNSVVNQILKKATLPDMATVDNWTFNPSFDRVVNSWLESEKITQQDAGVLLDYAQKRRREGHVPDAPFKKTWPELLLKRMVREAAEGGYDQIAWTDGATQAERYDLSKHVDMVEYNKATNTLRAFKGSKLGGPRAMTLVDQKVTPDKLADHIGKDVADKLLNNPTEKDSATGNIHVVKGLDLKVGGEGMKGFYDQIMPRTAEKLFKKYGTKTEIGKIPYTDPMGAGVGVNVKELEDGTWVVVMENGAYRGGWRTKSAALQNLDKMHSHNNTIHVMKITPELRRAALDEGFPLFSTGVPITGEQQPEHRDARPVRLVPVDNDPFAGAAP